MTPERYADLLFRREALQHRLADDSSLAKVVELIDELLEAYEDALIGLRRQRICAERFVAEIQAEEASRPNAELRGLSA